MNQYSTSHKPWSHFPVIQCLLCLAVAFLLSACKTTSEPETATAPETFPVEGFDSAANMTLYVGPSLKPGVDTAGPVMQVKENPSEDYQPFSGNIQGFNYQQGYTYEIKVRRLQRFGAPESAPSAEYYLQEVVKKTPVSSNSR